MKTTVFFAVICIAFMSGCKKDSSSNSYTPDCSGGTKSWNADVKPVMEAGCVSCHGSYSTYSAVYASRSSIRSKIADGSMPEGSSLSTGDKDIVVCWIDNGAPNN
jgi:hypothetical protein